MAKYVTSNNIVKISGILEFTDGTVIKLNDRVPFIDFDPNMIQHYGDHILVEYDEYPEDKFESLLEIQALFHSLKMAQHKSIL
jgi:hypothetical protein